MKKTRITALLLIIPFVISSQEIRENILENASYIERMAHFKKNPLQEDCVVFFGNSITQAGKWEIYFPNQQTANRGISGDNTDGMLARIDEVIKAKPKMFFFMGGINDMSLQRKNSKIAERIFMLIRKIREESPETKIFIQSTLPINDGKLKYSRLKNKEKRIEDLNRRLKSFCKREGITFIDVYSNLLSAPRTLNPDYTSDGLHINEEAYKVWTELIKKYVEQ